jgi:20S proteasome subunit alpha 7
MSCTTFSPDGRVFQVEYAGKAVENGSTTLGIRCKDGVVLAVENVVLSKMLEEGANKRIHSVDWKIGVATSGLMADSRQVVGRCRTEVNSYRDFYDADLPVKVLAERVASYVQAHTLYGSLRPFGCSAIIGGVDKHGPQMFLVEPEGISLGYRGAAIGKAAAAAKTELEKLDFDEITVEEAVEHAARIIHMVHDAVKDKEFKLEITWVCEQSQWKHACVPSAIVERADNAAKAALEEMLDDSDEDAL